MTLPDDSEKPSTPADGPAAFPGVYTAFELITPSYQQAMQRLDAMGSRLQALLGFSGTLTIGGTVLAASLVDGIDLDSVWFGLVMVAFILTFAIGLYAPMHGNLRLLSPSKIYDLLLGGDEWTLKKDLLAFAGEDFDENMALVKWKANAAAIMSGLLLVETLLFVVWVVVEG